MPHDPHRTLIQFLVTIAFLIVVTIFNWIKKQAHSAEPTETRSEREPSSPGQPTAHSRRSSPPPAAPRPTSWEEELRRLLEGESAPPPPLPPQPAHEEPRYQPAPPPLLPQFPLPVVYVSQTSVA